MVQNAPKINPGDEFECQFVTFSAPKQRKFQKQKQSQDKAVGSKTAKPAQQTRQHSKAFKNDDTNPKGKRKNQGRSVEARGVVTAATPENLRNCVRLTTENPAFPVPPT